MFQLTRLGDQISDNGKHGDTSVLEFDVSESVELFFITIGNKSKGVEETKRSLGTKFVLEGSQRGGLGRLLGGSESNGLDTNNKGDWDQNQVLSKAVSYPW